MLVIVRVNNFKRFFERKMIILIIMAVLYGAYLPYGPLGALQ